MNSEKNKTDFAMIMLVVVAEVSQIFKSRYRILRFKFVFHGFFSVHFWKSVNFVFTSWPTAVVAPRDIIVGTLRINYLCFLDSVETLNNIITCIYSFHNDYYIVMYKEHDSTNARFAFYAVVDFQSEYHFYFLFLIKKKLFL